MSSNPRWRNNARSALAELMQGLNKLPAIAAGPDGAVPAAAAAPPKEEEAEAEQQQKEGAKVEKETAEQQEEVVVEVAEEDVVVVEEEVAVEGATSPKALPAAQDVEQGGTPEGASPCGKRRRDDYEHSPEAKAASRAEAAAEAAAEVGAEAEGSCSASPDEVSAAPSALVPNVPAPVAGEAPAEAPK